MRYTIVGYAISTDGTKARLVIRSDAGMLFTVDVTENDGVSITDVVTILDREKFYNSIRNKIANAVVGQEIEI